MGRPLTENTELISFRINPNLLADIEEAAEEDELNRSDEMRLLLEDGLRFREARSKSLGLRAS